MLSVEHLNFQYSLNSKILNNINFQVNDGEFVSILGESGSGKSTLLKMIYGLEDAVSGKIVYKEKKVTGPKFNLIPGHPDMKFVPQEFDLLEYVTVAENVGKYLSNFNLPLKKEMMEEALETVNMLEFKNEFPTRLSGGQRQRVSIARALAAEPKLLLLDEPYSHLDQPLKFEIRKNIRNWAKENGCSVILTTHDVNDALEFSDKMIILKDGKIIQNASPETLRNYPENEYIASLLGEYSFLNSAQMKRLFDIEIPEGKKAIVYPEEMEENPDGTEFEIRDVRFRGRDYLVEAVSLSSTIKFYSKLKPESQLIKLELKNFRLI